MPEHLRIALDRTEIVCVQNAYNLVDRTSQPVLDACIEHGIAFVPFFPLGSAFTADNPVLGHPAVKSEAVEARPHTGADRTRVDAVRRAECAADSRHVVGGASRGEHRRRATSSSTTRPKHSSTTPPNCDLAHSRAQREMPTNHSTSTQSSVRCTAFCQPAYPSARCSSLHAGLQRLPSCQLARRSSGFSQNPTARPAA